MLFLMKLFILLSLTTVILCRRGNHHSSSSSFSSSSEEDRRNGRVHVHIHKYDNNNNNSKRRSKPIRVGAPRPVKDVIPEPVPKCDAGWTMLDRNGKPWCVKVDYLPGDHAHAENYCRSKNATLSGVHDSAERMRIADEGLKVITRLGHKVGGIWLGAQSVDGCHKDSGKCGPTRSFQWTDKYTEGVDGFKWGRKEPDNTFWGKPACVQQIILSPDYHGKQYSNFEHGDFDKFCCEHEQEPSVKLYVCGKKVDWVRP